MGFIVAELGTEFEHFSFMGYVVLLLTDQSLYQLYVSFIHRLLQSIFYVLRVYSLHKRVLKSHEILLTVNIATHALLILIIDIFLFLPYIFPINFFLLLLELSIKFISYLSHYSSCASVALARLKVYILDHGILPFKLILFDVFDFLRATC